MKEQFNTLSIESLRHSITDMKRQLSSVFMPKSRGIKGSGDSILGQCCVDSLATPVFDALFGGGFWSAVGMAEQAVEIWNEEESSAPEESACGSFNAAAIVRMEGWLEEAIYSLNEMEWAQNHAPVPVMV